MTRLFVSHSLGPREWAVVNAFCEHAARDSVEVFLANRMPTALGMLSTVNLVEIGKADLIVGFLSQSGPFRQAVIDEMTGAMSAGKSWLLLAEQGVAVNRSALPHTVVFDPHHPEPAAQQALALIKEWIAATAQPKKSNAGDVVGALVIGGLIGLALGALLKK